MEAEVELDPAVDASPHRKAVELVEGVAAGVHAAAQDLGELSDQRAEPMAADARAEGDGYKLARLKLVAGLIGVGLDDLRQRETHRRIRRMSLITTASIAGMIMTLSSSF